MPPSPHPSSPLTDDPRTLSSTCSWDTLSRVFPGAAHSFPWPQASKCCPGYPRLGFNFHFFLIRKTIVGRIVIIPQVFITSSILPTPWLPDTCRVGILSPIVSEEETGPQKGAETSERPVTQPRGGRGGTGTQGQPPQSPNHLPPSSWDTFAGSAPGRRAKGVFGAGRGLLTWLMPNHRGRIYPGSRSTQTV